MGRVLSRSIPILFLTAAAATPAAGQYRRQAEPPEPLYAVTASIGALLPFKETITPVEPAPPEEDRRGLRSSGAAPWVSLSGRYGRGLGFYGTVAFAFPEDAELDGNDPLTGEPLDGTTEMGMISMYSAGVSFTPLRDVVGLRMDVGPSWLELGEGGSYLAIHLGAAAKFLEIGDRGGVLVAWDGYFAGGQEDRDEIEYRIRGGRLSGVRAGFELTF